MSEPEKFLERWSRRKREAGAEQEPAPEPKADTAPAPAKSDATDAKAPEEFDIADLPPIESIGADTDVRAFLRPGVPPDLTRAALRRAWSADPAIRDFIGPVENGWDFTAPGGVPGFGAITAEEAARLVTQVVGAITDEPNAARAELSQDQKPVLGTTNGEEPASPEAEVTLQCKTNNAAPQDDSES